MDTAEKIHSELNDCLNNINSAGLGSFDPRNIETLDSICAAATGLGMDQGKKLIENLSTALKNFREGKTGEDSVSVRITALDFYLKNIQGGGSTEEL